MDPNETLECSKHHVGLDIGATKWLVLADGNHDPLCRGLTTDDPSETIHGICTTLKQQVLITQTYVGCSFAGVLDSRGVILSWPNRPKWQGFDLARSFAEFGVRVVVEDDGVCAAIGEKAYGCATQIDNFLCVTFGTGVGSGLVLDGRIRRHKLGVPNGIGHFRTFSNAVCRCGQVGCIQAIFQSTASESNDSPAPRHLAFVASDLAMLLDLEAVVLSGGLLSHSKDFTGELATAMGPMLLDVNCNLLVADRPELSPALGALEISRSQMRLTE